MRTEEQFVLDMQPFSALFIGSNDIRRYYTAFNGRMFDIANIYIKDVMRSIGYDNIIPFVNSGEYNALKVIGTNDSDYYSWALRVPNDFIVDFSSGFLNTQLNGKILLTEIVSLNQQGKIQFNIKETLFKEILTKFIIASPFDAFGENLGFVEMHNMYIRYKIKFARETEDLKALMITYMIKEFMKAAAYSLPSELKQFYLSPNIDNLDTRLIFNLKLYDFLFITETLVSDYTINKIDSLFRYTKFFNKFKFACNPTINNSTSHLDNFISKFRLDLE